MLNEEVEVEAAPVNGTTVPLVTPEDVGEARAVVVAAPPTVDGDVV